MSDRFRAAAWALATGNAGKLRELRDLLADVQPVLRDLSEFPDAVLPPEGDDYARNALAKATALARTAGLPALGDDSGLEVDALGGRPGMHSARYGGPGLDDAGRVGRLLAELADVPETRRGARFVCVMALVTPAGDALTAVGVCDGRILVAPRGNGGFGYDPVFAPAGDARSMAELSAREKDAHSHRGRAIGALRSKLSSV